MSLSPFDAISLNYMLAHDAQMEGITDVSHYLPDVRAGAFSRHIGGASPGSNISRTDHGRAPGVPIGSEMHTIVTQAMADIM